MRKECEICGKEFPVTVWNRKYCSRKCNEKAKSRTLQRKLYLKKWFKSGGREWHNEYNKRYNKRNYVKEKRKEINARPESKKKRLKYQKGKGKPIMKKAARKYQSSEQGKASNQKRASVRRARLRNVEENFTTLMRRALREAFGNKCIRTGMTKEEHLEKYRRDLHIDHIESLNGKGKPLTFDNAALLTLSVNSGEKRDRFDWNFFTNREIRKIKKYQQKAKRIYETKYKQLEPFY